MLNAIKQRLDREDEGFTLIELMVVVLIIAILLAIAIPTFLGARNSANARAAQSDLRNGLTAEQTEWTNGQSFDNNSGGAMQNIESALYWTTAAPSLANPHTVSVAVGDADTSNNNQVVMLGAYSRDGNCYYILQSNDPAHSFTGYSAEKQSATHTCPAADATAFNTTPQVTAVTLTDQAAGANVAATGTAVGSLTWYTHF